MRIVDRAQRACGSHRLSEALPAQPSADGLLDETASSARPGNRVDLRHQIRRQSQICRNACSHTHIFAHDPPAVNKLGPRVMDPTLPYSRIMADFGPNATAVAGFLEADPRRERGRRPCARRRMGGGRRTAAVKCLARGPARGSECRTHRRARGGSVGDHDLVERVFADRRLWQSRCWRGANARPDHARRGARPGRRGLRPGCRGPYRRADFEALYGPWRSVDEEGGVTAPPR